MFRRLFLVTTFALPVFLFAGSSSDLFAEHCTDKHRPCESKCLVGKLTYAFQGTFGVNSLTEHTINESGTFEPHCDGTFTAVGLAVVDGAVPVKATYNGTFTVQGDVAIFHTQRTSGGSTIPAEFRLVLAKKCNHVSIQALPSSDPTSPFHFVNVTGSGDRIK
jgi:hypothetical protein